jgi:cell division protein FtsX
MECGKWDSPLDESLQVAITRAEATQKVQHQGLVSDRLAEVTEGVRHALHLVAVLSHGEVP